jgi:hypothetical protein
VTTLALIDVDEDGPNELLAGSEDYMIRIFQKEEVISETQEAAKINALCPIRFTKYGSLSFSLTHTLPLSLSLPVFPSVSLSLHDLPVRYVSEKPLSPAFSLFFAVSKGTLLRMVLLEYTINLREYGE